MYSFSPSSGKYEVFLPGSETTAPPSVGVGSSGLGEVGGGVLSLGGVGSSSSLGGGSETPVVELSSHSSTRDEFFR